MTTVTVWNGYRHERDRDAAAAVSPDGIHAVLADAPVPSGANVPNPIEDVDADADTCSETDDDPTVD